ncbi:MAG: hypothetical protein ABI340_04520 [Nitrososphaera sp.]|jgi:hypothetical protein
MRTPREIAERWVIGMLHSPPIECPVCGKRTRADIQCQWCKKEWTKEQLELRAEQRRLFISSYPQNQP